MNDDLLDQQRQRRFPLFEVELVECLAECTGIDGREFDGIEVGFEFVTTGREWFACCVPFLFRQILRTELLKVDESLP